MFRIFQNPMLCIGSFIEAAVYARSELELILMSAEQKITHIVDTLFERHYNDQRTVIICNRPEEVQALVHRLKQESITPSNCDETSNDAEIGLFYFINKVLFFFFTKNLINLLDFAKGWNSSTTPGQYNVLVCTDAVLFDLNIDSAQNLIHFSMPDSWSKFSMRFSAMSNYFEDFVNDAVARRPLPYSLILLDEKNNEQLPKVVEFLLEHQTRIDPKVLAMVQTLRNKIEEERQRNRVSFCPRILLLGQCSASNSCPMRHTLVAADRSKAVIPRSGYIKMEIQHCHSPTHYSVRIVEYLPVNGDKWLPAQLSTNFLDFSISFAAYYSNHANLQIHCPVKAGDICVVAEEDDVTMNSVYHRCMVIALK